MNRHISRLMILTMLLVLPAISMAGGLSPERLRCEYRVNPLGVDEPTPRLDWIVTSDQPGQYQSAYRILTASSREDLDRDSGDLWDTGRVESDETIQVPYEGKPLGAGERCYWKVMVWDKSGSASGWSEPAIWSMGMMGREWDAKWIGKDAPVLEIRDLYFHIPPPLAWDLKIKTPGPKGMQKLFLPGAVKTYLPPPFLRKEFNARGGLKNAFIHATALGVYELHLNGRKVGDDYFTPGWSDYKERVYYQTYDVTDLIDEDGPNAVGAILSDGWYAGNIGLKGQRYYGDKTRFYARLTLEYEDGSADVIVTDESWRASRGPILEADVQYGEHYDARRETPGWDMVGYDDHDWEGVEVTSRVGIKVESYPGVPVRRTMEICPISVTEPRPGLFVFDMGQNFAGWARLKVTGSAGDKVVMRFGEMRNEDGTVYTANLRTARATDVYVLKGGQEEIWEPRFTYHGFQYVELEGYPGEPGLDAITGVVAHSDLAIAGSLETSNPLVNKLYSNITWGQRSNYFEVPTDCPQRDERLGWTGDAQVFMRTATYNMDVAPFFTKWLVDLSDGQDEKGRFPDVAPNVLPGAAAGWGDAGVICPYNMYLVYGDLRVLEKNYTAMADFMEFMKRRSKNNISPPLGIYGDWLNIDDPTPLRVVATAYHAYDCTLMARIAKALDKPEDEAVYVKRFEDIAAAFARTFVDAGGKVQGDSQTAYLLALGFDLLPDEIRPLAEKRLADKIEENGGLLSTGFLGLKMLLPVLTEMGRTDLAYQLLTNRRYPSWGYSIDQGATTVWERWNSYTIEKGFGPVSMNSFNHYAYGSVGEWMLGSMAGIDTDGPAYKKILIQPRPGGDLTWVRAHYDSIRGRISVHWRVEEGLFKLDATIPANASAKVIMPGGEGKVHEVGSGDHSFACHL